jgi:hypothetical protein
MFFLYSFLIKLIQAYTLFLKKMRKFTQILGQRSQYSVLLAQPGPARVLTRSKATALMTEAATASETSDTSNVF